jgi:hypothetical protein
MSKHLKQYEQSWHDAEQVLEDNDRPGGTIMAGDALVLGRALMDMGGLLMLAQQTERIVYNLMQRTGVCPLCEFRVHADFCPMDSEYGCCSYKLEY